MNELLRAIKKMSWSTVLPLWGFASLLFVFVAVPAWQSERTLGMPSLITGYSLFACIVFLSLFKVRKHLSMLPLIPAKFWFSMHSMIGVLALCLYLLHVDHWWPNSGYVQFLAALMLAVTFTGFIGYALEKTFPARLTQKGSEVIFENIPDACYQIRTEAKSVLFSGIKDTGSDSLSRYYMEAMDWYFQRPRFLWSHLSGGRKGDYWIKQQFLIINRHLSDSEKIYSQQLEKLAYKKHDIDFQYSVQGLLKLWLLLHVPLSVMLILMSLWHLLLVNIYAV